MNETVHIALRPGEKLVAAPDRPVRKKPNFVMVGNGTTNKDGLVSIDLVREMSELTKPAMYTLLWIKEAIVWDNPDGEVCVYMSDLTNAQQQQFKRGYKELSTKGLALRTRRSHYMINPNALIPLDYPLAMKLWNQHYRGIEDV